MNRSNEDNWNEEIFKSDMVMQNGYRYIPLCTNKHKRQKQEDWPVNAVTLSPHDRSTEVFILNEGRAVKHRQADKGGYRSVFGTHGALSGTFYFEAMISGLLGGAIRLGVATLNAHLSGPVGMDRHGYAVCSTGHIVHDSVKHPFLPSALSEDSVVGILVHLPCVQGGRLYSEQVPFEEPNSKKSFLQCKLINSERKEYIPGAFIRVFVNGQDQGVAFDKIFEGCYFPMISVYRSGRADVNFGPEFAHPIFNDQSAMPWSCLYKNSF